jgi:hypothetical protein
MRLCMETGNNQINELLTYFGMLGFQSFFSQKGCRVRTAWKNQSINTWTSYMGVGQFIQINSNLN